MKYLVEGDVWSLCDMSKNVLIRSCSLSFSERFG